MLSNSTNITLDTEQDWDTTDIILIPTVGLVVAIGCGVALNRLCPYEVKVRRKSKITDFDDPWLD